MFEKNMCAGLILLFMLTLGGCWTGGMAKDVVFSRELKATDGAKNANYTVSIQQTEAQGNAEAAFRKYFSIKNIDKSLVLKAALIEDDGVLWMNPYWKLTWLSGKKPIYSAEIDAQSGEVVLLVCRQSEVAKTASREDLLAYQDTALAFIDKFALVKGAPLSIFDAGCFDDGAFVEFRYGTGKFIRLQFNKAGDITGFNFSQKISYMLQGSDLKIDRAEAMKLARKSVEQYFGPVDTCDLIEKVQLVEGDKEEKIWFVFWENIPALTDRDIAYGAHIYAWNGEVGGIMGRNLDSVSKTPVLEEEKLLGIADRFLEKNNLSDYHLESCETCGQSLFLKYQGKHGSQLHLYVDQPSGKVCFISFFKKELVK